MSVAELPKTEYPTPARPHDGALPLDSLEIKNFRAFRHLTIEKLGRVNLITGKNNVGKTALLEALRIYASHGRPDIFHAILERRDEIGEPLTFIQVMGYVSASNDAAGWLPYLGSLFHGRKNIYQWSEPFSITPINQSGKMLEISINFAPVDIKGDFRLSADSKLDLAPISEDSSLETLLNAKPFIKIKAPGLPESVLPLEQFFGLYTGIYWTQAEYVPCEFVSTEDTLEDDRRWEEIKQRGLREYILEALHLIDRQTTDIEFFAQGKGALKQLPMVKIAGGSGFIPIKRMGEGMNRLMRFSLAAPLASQGVLLVDEIENGLHYSILPSVWDYVFRLARQFNFQVFATTHSWDCIRAFEWAAAQSPEEGVLIKLRRNSGDIEAATFDEEELETVVEQNIEVR